jgi:hypothetical protein
LKRWMVLIFGTAGFLMVQACNLRSPCDPSQLGAPGDLSPADREIVSQSPTLRWTYPASSPSPYPYPAGASNCALSGYEVRIVQAHTWNETSIPDWGGTAFDSSFTPGAPLSPATLYFWEVRAQSPLGNGPWSGYRAFYTGPACDTASLAGPELRRPPDASNVTELRPTLSWYLSASCVPESFRIELSTDPTFTTSGLSDVSEYPADHWEPTADLANCTTYYWHVAPVNGRTLGSYSVIRSFRTSVNFCAPVPVIPSLVAPLLTVVPSPIPLEGEAATFNTNKNANCRYGPSQVYETLTSVLAGETFPVEGKNEEGNWFYVLLPDRSRCWISIATGQLIGDPDLIPIIYDLLPMPVISPYSACHDYPDAATCKADPANFGKCTWDLKLKKCAP